MTGDGPRSYVGPRDEQDKYRLLRQVGHGGEAELWKAELDLVGGQEPVAVKILHANHQGEIATWRQRWTDQVDLLRLIHHPGVVGVHTLFEGPRMHPRHQVDPSTSCLYLVMNWVDGLPLRDWVAQHPGPEHRVEALQYLGQVAAVLDHLHGGGATPSGRPVVHGDISPSNVIINSDGQAVLVDFGLFRITRHVTVMGAGTAGYCAPEVARGGEYSPASDRYAFGGLAYYTLTGTHPPADPQQLRAGLSVIAGVGDRSANVDELAAIFSEDPTLRPSAGQWLRLLRLHSSTASARSGPLAPLARGAIAPPPQSGPAPSHGPTVGRQRPWTVLATAAVLITSVLLVVGAAALLFPRAGIGQPDQSDNPTLSSAGQEPTSTASQTQPPSTGAPTPSTEPSNPETSAPGNTSDGKRADLGQLTVVDSTGSTWVALTIDGKAYPKALGMSSDRCWLDGPFRVEYQLSRQYTRFHAVVGIDDLAQTGTTATFTVLVDGVKKDSKTVALTQTEIIDVPLTNAFRMEITLSVTSTLCDDHEKAGFIDPYVVAA